MAHQEAYLAVEGFGIEVLAEVPGSDRGGEASPEPRVAQDPIGRSPDLGRVDKPLGRDPGG